MVGPDNVDIDFEGELRDYFDESISVGDVDDYYIDNYAYNEVFNLDGCNVHMVGVDSSSYVSRVFLNRMFDDMDFDVVMPVLGRTHLFHILDFLGQNFDLDGVEDLRGDIDDVYSGFDEGLSDFDVRFRERLNSETKFELDWKKDNDLGCHYECLRRCLDEGISVEAAGWPILEDDFIYNAVIKKFFYFPVCRLLKRIFLDNWSLDVSRGEYHLNGAGCCKYEEDLHGAIDRDTYHTNLVDDICANFDYNGTEAYYIAMEVLREYDWTLSTSSKEMSEEERQFTFDRISDCVDDESLVVVDILNFHYLKQKFES